MKLNLGCKKHHIKGFVNIDIDESVKPDVVMDALELKYEDESVDEIYASHLLEHFDYETSALALIEWYRVLKRDGILWIVIPDSFQAFDLFRWGEISRQMLNQVILANVEAHAQNHHQVLSARIVFDDLNELGFSMVEIVDSCLYTQSNPEWQSIIRGIK